MCENRHETDKEVMCEQTDMRHTSKEIGCEHTGMGRQTPTEVGCEHTGMREEAKSVRRGDNSAGSEGAPPS